MQTDELKDCFFMKAARKLLVDSALPSTFSKGLWVRCRRSVNFASHRVNHFALWLSDCTCTHYTLLTGPFNSTPTRTRGSLRLLGREEEALRGTPYFQPKRFWGS
ncbi:hypothetical protein TNCV_2947241 [Trichonephila clavipes]|nr:hypothetical protein TNCV_2947241 [Trichonephila clavipes]